MPNQIIVFIFGLLIGSFLNCLIFRVKQKEDITKRSYCPKCVTQIAWYDNIPVLSFILLRGRCRKCRSKISIQYPLVELITAILFLISFSLNSQKFINLDWEFLVLIFRDFFIIGVMIFIFIYDLRWYLIPDIISLPACLIIFILNFFSHPSWFDIGVCAIIGTGFFLIQFLISQGKWIGGGDIRLGLLMGIIFSTQGIDFLILAILFGYFIGSIIGIALILAGKKKMGSQLPLGVFLSISTLIILFYGERILEWYFSLI